MFRSYLDPLGDGCRILYIDLRRREHPQLQDLGPRSQDLENVLNAAGAMLDALTPVRNKASLAHPNKDLLGRDEAQLVVNAGRTLLAYLDAKIGAE